MAAQRQADMDASRAMWESGEMEDRLRERREIFDNAKTALLNIFAGESYGRS